MHMLSGDTDPTAGQVGTYSTKAYFLFSLLLKIYISDCFSGLGVK